MRNSFIFYKSFADAILRIENAEDRAQAYDAIVNYAIYGEEIPTNGVAAMVFDLAKPQIDANNARYVNGKKGAEFGKLGGRPKKEKEPEKPKAKPEPKSEKPQEDPEKESKQKYGEYKHVMLTPTEYGKLCADFGDVETGRAITYLDEYIERKGYKAKSHYLCIRKWVFDAVKQDAQKKAKIARIDQGGTADDWFKERGFL